MYRYVFFLLSIFWLIPLTAWASSFEKNATYSVCFTPGADCTQQVVDAINSAVDTIWVQAYSFTSRPIGKALVFAKQRGVNVQVILDKSNLSHSGTLNYFIRHHIPVWIDNQLPGIAHNKVMIIDETRVITGSFNFTYAAQQANAENVLIIDDHALAESYLHNWQERQQASQAYLWPTTPMWQPSWIERLWIELLAWIKSWLHSLTLI